MIILIDKNKNDLVVNIDNMATSPDNKHKKHAGPPYKVVTFNNLSGGYIILKCYYDQHNKVSVELTIKKDEGGDYYNAIGYASCGNDYRSDLLRAMQQCLGNLNITLDDKQQVINRVGEGEYETAMKNILFAIANSLNWDSVIINEIYL